MISISFNQQSINHINQTISKYKDNLSTMCESFLNSLLDKGYDVAINNAIGTFGGYISIYKQLDKSVDGIKGILYATDSGNIQSVFKHGGEIVSIDISPLLMCEFGSGLKAENPLGIQGVGQGSLNTYGHAFGENGWYFVTIDDEFVHSYGYTPHAPMYKAMLSMEEEIINVAREVFA